MEPEEQALLDELLAHEDELQFSTFTNDTAWTVGTALVDAAWRAGAAVTVDIRRGDWVIFHHAMEGTTPDNTVWIERKIRTVQRFRHSSFYLGTYYRLHHGGFESKTGLSLQEYAAHGGCFPILVRNAGMIGTITVSGLPQAQDHALVVDVLRAHLQPQR
jgi:uncharacterized protein (UPF0303 family)